MAKGSQWIEASDATSAIVNGRLDCELADRILAQFGGLGGVASELKLQYDATTRGSRNAIAILHNIEKLLVETSSRPKEDSGLTEADIESQLRDVHRKLAEMEPCGG